MQNSKQMLEISHDKLRFAIVFLLLARWSLAASADVYLWQDQKGKTHYSDRAIAESKKIQLNPGYSYFRVAYIYDGDTVKLEDGRKIRLLGINTPEVRHRNQMTEAGGEAAKRWLTQKLENRKVRLVTDVEQADKYKRTLAHLITEDKDHINVQLVELGLAAVNIYPPNLLYVNELVAAGNRAEQAKRGIWGLPDYAAIPVGQIDENGHPGWLRLVGKVSAIRSSRKFVYLEFSPKLQARIEKQWLTLFPDLNKYLGKTLEIRGWLNKNRGGWSMLIRHPSAIREIPS